MTSKPGMKRYQVEAHPNQGDVFGSQTKLFRLPHLTHGYIGAAWWLFWAHVGEDGATNREAYEALRSVMPWGSVTASASYLRKAGFLRLIGDRMSEETGVKSKTKMPANEVGGRQMYEILHDESLPWAAPDEIAPVYTDEDEDDALGPGERSL